MAEKVVVLDAAALFNALDATKGSPTSLGLNLYSMNPAQRIVIAPEVYFETVRQASRSSNPATLARGAEISRWINQNATRIIGGIDPLVNFSPPVVLPKNFGEQSIADWIKTNQSLYSAEIVSGDSKFFRQQELISGGVIPGAAGKAMSAFEYAASQRACGALSASQLDGLISGWNNHGGEIAARWGTNSPQFNGWLNVMETLRKYQAGIATVGAVGLAFAVYSAEAKLAEIRDQRPDDIAAQLEPWVLLATPFSFLAGASQAAVLAHLSYEQRNGTAGALDAALNGFLLGMEAADQAFAVIYRSHTGGDIVPEDFRLLRADQLRVEGDAIVAASRWEYTFTNGSPADPLEYRHLAAGPEPVVPGYHFTVRDRQTGHEYHFYAGQVGDAFATPTIGLGVRSSSGAFFSASVTQQSLEQAGYIDTTSQQPGATGNPDVLQVRMINGGNAGDVVEIRTRPEGGITTTSVSEQKAAAARAEAEKARQAALIAERQHRQNQAQILGADIQFGQSIGQAFGSSIGNAIAGDNVFARIGASTVLGATLGTIGAGFGRYASAA